MSASTFALGVTYTSQSPVGPFAGLPATMAANLSASTTAANQHLFNYGGAVGASATVDRHYAGYDWSSIDSRVADMATQKAHLEFITLHQAPNWMTGGPDGDYAWGAGHRVLDAYLDDWAEYCHYVVSRYLPQGVRHYQVWNELKGYWGNGGWDFDAYLQMYNTVWDRIKADPATAAAQLGGPYAIMTNHQDRSWPSGPSTLVGPWGGVDPDVTNGYQKFFAQAHGFDFVAVDLSDDDDSGNHGGSYNPMGLPDSVKVVYFHDVVAWIRAQTTKPIVASEIYWGDAGVWPAAVDNFRSGGGNVFLLWHETDGVAGRLVNESDGSLTPLGQMFRDYRKSHGD